MNNRKCYVLDVAKLFFISFCVLYSVSFLLPVSTFAYESISLPLPKTLPGSAWYPFKRLWEKVSFKFIFSEGAKINYQKKLVETRLVELKILSDNKVYDQIERASQRFAYQAGVQTDLVSAISNEHKSQLLVNYENYKKILERIRDYFEANRAYWLVTQQDIDTINILSEKLK